MKFFVIGLSIKSLTIFVNVKELLSSHTTEIRVLTNTYNRYHIKDEYGQTYEKGNMILKNKRTRTQRLAHLRDILRQYICKQTLDIVIQLDSDTFLHRTFKTNVFHAITLLESNKYHLICANGLWRKGKNKGKYYDTSATITEDNHFIINPYRNRDVPDPQSPFDLVKIEEYRSPNYDNVIQVRSCFGGLSLYHYSAFCQSNCKYVHKSKKPFVNYTYLHGLLCEHIPFNICLHSKKFKIGILTNLTHLWHY